jgi:hypothetical protein
MKTLLILLFAEASVAFLCAQTMDTNKPVATVEAWSRLNLLSGTPANTSPQMEKPDDFDFDTGFDATWAAEKKLIGLFSAEGFIMQGLPHKGGVENAVFQRASDGAKVNYAYVRPLSGRLAEYRLSASRNSPGLTVLLSIAGKISRDRLSAINDAIKEFNTTKQAVAHDYGGFKERGNFRVKTDETTLELVNLWKQKGI